MVEAYGFRIFRHLSCSVCIMLTYSFENGERGHVWFQFAFLFIIYAYSQLRCVMKRQPPALAFVFVLQSVLFFLCFSPYYSLCNDKQYINPFAIIAD